MDQRPPLAPTTGALSDGQVRTFTTSSQSKELGLETRRRAGGFAEMSSKLDARLCAFGHSAALGRQAQVGIRERHRVGNQEARDASSLGDWRQNGAWPYQLIRSFDRTLRLCS